MEEKKELEIVFTEDHGHIIACVPELNLTGYGDSKEEALEMLHSGIMEYVKLLNQILGLSNKITSALLFKKVRSSFKEVTKEEVEARRSKAYQYLL